MVIVDDALDEWEDHDLVMEAISESLIARAQADSVPLRFLITSRLESYVVATPQLGNQQQVLLIFSTRF